MTGFAGSDRGQMLYRLLKEHGWSLEDWAAKHPADKRFLQLARAEHSRRVEKERENA